MRNVHKIKREGISFALILLMSLWLYTPAFKAHFLFDDYPTILRNPFIKTLNPVSLWQFNPSQFIVHVTFALNYAAGRLNPFGWHVVNVILHGAVGFCLYRLVLLLGQTPRGKKLIEEKKIGLVALATAVVFLVLPFFTSTVIYVSQRTTLVSALLYLGSLGLFLKGRINRQIAWIFYAVMGVFLGAWMDPVFVSFPLILLLMKFCFFENDRKNFLQQFCVYASLGVSLAVLFWLITSGCFGGFSHPFWERMFYLPAAGLVLMVSIFFHKITARWRKETKVVSLILLIAFLAVYSRQRISLWQDPVVFLQKLIVQYPHEPRVYQELGQILEEAKNYRQAEEVYTQSLAIDPDYFLTLNNLGFLYLKQNRPEEADRIFKSLTHRYPDVVDPYVGLAYCYQVLGQLDRSRSILELANRIDPNSPTVHAGLGKIYTALGQGFKAKDEYEMALALDPDDTLSYYNLGNVFFGLQRFDSAMDYYEKALSLRPDLPEAYNNIGNIFFYFHDYKKSIEYYQKAVRYDPSLAQGYFNLANALHASGAVEESRKAIETALNLFRRQNRQDMVQHLESKLKSTRHDPVDTGR